MKKALLILISLSTIVIFSQQKKHILDRFDTSKMQTSVLVQKSPLFNLQDYQKEVNNVYGFYQVFKTIQQSDLENQFIDITQLKLQEKQSYINHTIPLAVLISDYETIKSDAFKNGKVTNDNEGYLIRNSSENIFNKHTIFISSTLKSKHKGLQTTFKLETNHIFNTTNNSIKEIKIDFNDGKDFRKIIPNINVTVNYLTAGKKNIKFEITLSDNSIIKNTSTLEIQYDNNDLNRFFNRTPSGFTSSITADLSIYGEATNYAGQGEYEIFMSTEPNAVFDKPIIIIDGFDPQDGRPIVGYTDGNTGNFVKGIYELLDFTNTTGSTENLADLIRAEGFDVVVLNFPLYVRAQDNAIIDGGADFIERNAMLLVELIDIVNSQKIGNQQNVIIGPSMGGLISRYALNYMEQQSLNHDTRLWLSFDSPHLGANVPIGFQHQFNYLAFGLDDFWFIGNQNVEALQPLINGFMKSNAARQMLIDNFESHITDDDGVTFNSNLTLPQSHPFKTTFYNRLNALTTSGYPENLRKISIINGSGNGLPFNDINGNPILPSRTVVDVVIDVETGVDAYLEDTFTPYINNQIEVSNVYIDFAWFIPAFDVESIAESRAQTYSHGVDASSGGLFNLGEITDDIGTDGIAGEFLNALQTDFFNFIPSVSAMAVEFSNNEINWFNTNYTNNPFDARYMPNENEPHVTLTQENVDFAWDEIVLQDPASVHENNLENLILISNNPVSSSLNLINNTTVTKLNISIFNVTGKEVLTRLINNPSSKIEIPLQINTGVYFVKIIADDIILNKKIILK